MSQGQRLLVEIKTQEQAVEKTREAGLTWLNQGPEKEQWAHDRQPCYHLAGVDGYPICLLTLIEVEDYVRYARAVQAGEFVGAWLEWLSSGCALAVWRQAMKNQERWVWIGKKW